MKIMLILLVFLISSVGCIQQIPKRQFQASESAKEELKQLLDKAPSLDTFDVTYNFKMVLLDNALADVTSRQIKQGKNQRLDSNGLMFGFVFNATSVAIDGQQTTCATFNNTWKCSPGNEVCRETSNGRECKSVSNEGFPSIKPEMLAESEVGYASSKQIFGVEVKCYDMMTEESNLPVEFCFNQDGMILSMKGETKGFGIMFTAISFSKTVQPDSFILPATIS